MGHCGLPIRGPLGYIDALLSNLRGGRAAVDKLSYKPTPAAARATLTSLPSHTVTSALGLGVTSKKVRQKAISDRGWVLCV